ncbi:MAG: hypothetical protein ACOH1V_11020 [Stenotrophomonas sp.]
MISERGWTLAAKRAVNIQVIGIALSHDPAGGQHLPGRLRSAHLPVFLRDIEVENERQGVAGRAVAIDLNDLAVAVFIRCGFGAEHEAQTCED